MSEIRATTISDAAGTGPITLTGQSAAKAWCYFNGSGTVAVVNSFNTSSLSDLGTGDYQINVINSFSSEAAHIGLAGNVCYWAANASVNELRISVTNPSGTLTDTNRVTGAGYGDLA